MNWLTKPLKFLVGVGANLLSDLAQIEHAVPSFTGILSAMTLWSGKFGVPGVVGSSIGIAGSSVALALPHIGAGVQAVETDLQALLRFATGGAGAPTPTAAGSSVQDVISEFTKAYAAVKNLEAMIVSHVTTQAPLPPTAPAPAPVAPAPAPPTSGAPA